MAAPLNTCTTIEQRGVMRFLWAKNMDAAKDIHKEMLPIWAAFLCGYPYLRNWCIQLVLLEKYITMHGPMNVKIELNIRNIFIF
jgi:hypothetical protein